MAARKVRNGELDFLKFIFSIIVVIFHSRSFGSESAGDDIFFKGGWLAVEFFFLVSGYFFIPSIDGFIRKLSAGGKEKTLYSENVSFIGNKIKSILGIYILAVIFAFAMDIIWVVTNEPEMPLIQMIFRMTKSIWNIIFLDSVLIEQQMINSAVWYLSAMFIAMFILYPLARKYRDVFVKFICPIASLLIMGVLESTKHLGINAMTGINVSARLIRAIAEIMIGCMIYSFVQAIKNSSVTLTGFNRFLITVLGYGSLGLSVLIMNYNSASYYPDYVDWRLDFVVLALLCVVVFVFASGFTVTGKLFANRLCAFLGSFSTTIFLMHIPCRKIVILYFLDATTYIEKTSTMLMLAVLVTLITMAILWLFRKIPESSKDKLKSLFIKPKAK